MTSIKRFITVSVVGLGFGLIAFGQQATTTQATTPTHPDSGFHPLPVGQKAPDFTAYTATDQKVNLSDLKGKVVILDFWASWCGPCKVSMPGLEKIYQQVKNDVVVLSLNTWDKKPDFKAWVEKNSGTKYHFEFVRDPAEGDHDAIRKASIAKRLYSVPGIPTMYIIDREGNIAGSFLSYGNEKGIVEVLGKLGISATVPPKDK